MKKTTLFAIILTLALGAAAASAQTTDTAQLDRFFDRLAEKNKAMGSLSIARDGQTLYSRAVGYSRLDGAEKKPASAATRYRIGSVSKLFTAVMIYQLVERGKLKLTDTLDKFYPQIPNAGKITIEQMLAHRSGIHSFTGDPDFPTWLAKPQTRDQMLAVIARGKPDFEPGEKMAYSNSGYILLGYIVEKAGGKPYQDQLKEKITAKIGLADTYLGTGGLDAGKNESSSYKFLGDWKPETETHPSIPQGAGALVSTPNDLVRFIKAVFDLKLISQESLDRMTQNKMGMFAFPLDGKTFYGHNGRIDGFDAIVLYLPEEKLAIAYASNGTVYPVNDILRGVFDIYRNKPFQIPTFESVAVAPEILEKYVGVYASPGFPLKITITRDAATLYAQATGQSAFPLEATAPDKFKFDAAGVAIEFDAAGKQMTLRQRGREFVFTKEN